MGSAVSLLGVGSLSYQWDILWSRGQSPAKPSLPGTDHAEAHAARPLGYLRLLCGQGCTGLPLCSPGEAGEPFWGTTVSTGAKDPELCPVAPLPGGSAGESTTARRVVLAKALLRSTHGSSDVSDPYSAVRLRRT